MFRPKPSEERTEDAVRDAPAAEVPQVPGGGRALIFTMDSIQSYVDASRKGGPAGEILVRRSLEAGLRELGVEPVVARGDDEFFQLAEHHEDFRFVFLDPWTFVGRGARAVRVIMKSSVLIQSFFNLSQISNPARSCKAASRAFSCSPSSACSSRSSTG